MSKKSYKSIKVDTNDCTNIIFQNIIMYHNIDILLFSLKKYIFFLKSKMIKKQSYFP